MPCVQSRKRYNSRFKASGLPIGQLQRPAADADDMLRIDQIGAVAESKKLAIESDSLFK